MWTTEFVDIWTFLISKASLLPRPESDGKSCAKPLPEDLGDEILHFTPAPGVKNSVDFWWQIFFRIFPRKNGLKFVTPKPSEIFTTFSTARKEIYHLELALGATSRKKSADTGNGGSNRYPDLLLLFLHGTPLQLAESSHGLIYGILADCDLLLQILQVLSCFRICLVRRSKELVLHG